MRNLARRPGRPGYHDELLEEENLGGVGGSHYDDVPELRGAPAGRPYDEVPELRDVPAAPPPGASPLRGGDAAADHYAVPEGLGVGAASHYSMPEGLRGPVPAAPPAQLPVAPAASPLRGGDAAADHYAVPEGLGLGAASHYSMPEGLVRPASPLAPPRPAMPAPMLSPPSSAAAPPRPAMPAPMFNLRPPAPDQYELKSVRAQHANESSPAPGKERENTEFVNALVQADEAAWKGFDRQRAAQGQGPVDRALQFRNRYGWTPDDYQRFIVNKETRHVQYLRTEADRAGYKIRPERGFMVREGTGEPVDTSAMSSKFSGVGFGIFVMSPAGDLYIGQHKVGLFHHSSFMGGGQVAGAGEMRIQEGVLIGITNKSGHYFPEYTQFRQVVRKLQSGGVDVSRVEAKYFHVVGADTTVHTGPASDILNMTAAQYVMAHPAPPKPNQAAAAPRGH